ncbi:MAG: hypothetical protein WBQ29_22375 [Isosphaeraceae bacterium]|jgi:hypothetical protein
MTFEQCKTTLSEIRHRQGTDHPLVQITCSGSVVRGRLTRTDTDRPPRSNQSSPYGLLALEQPGLVPGPLRFVQIANIPEDGLKEDAAQEESKVKVTQLVGAGRR